MPRSTPIPHNYLDDILNAVAAGSYAAWDSKLEDDPAGKRLLKARPEEQCRFVRMAVDWLENAPLDKSSVMVSRAVEQFLRRKLPFEHDDIIAILRWSLYTRGTWVMMPVFIKIVEAYLARHPRTSALQKALERSIENFRPWATTVALRRQIERLLELSRGDSDGLALLPGDAWADVARADIMAMAEPVRSAWRDLLKAGLLASSSTPGDTWLASVRPLLEQIGFDSFKDALLRWFPLVDQPRAGPAETGGGRMAEQPLLLQDRNADLLKGLVYLCAEREDPEIARALMALARSAYRKLPGIGPRSPRVGNACVWALGQMPGLVGVEQLARLRIRVSYGTAQRAIGSALESAATRIGLPPEEIEELLVPAYGLQEIGLRREEIGNNRAELAVIGASGLELRWFDSDGKRLASLPDKAREQHADLLKELAQAADDIKTMLPVQRERIEQCYLKRKTWAFTIWRERYLDHPLVGMLARRLIWSFRTGARRQAGIWHLEQIIGLSGPLDWLGETTQVELWHPLHEPSDRAVAWREWLAEHAIQQPFKQAHREIYPLTDAERVAQSYSNRFAAHILRQHQFNALCGARGWKNRLRLMVDTSYPPPMRLLPEWGLRAEFWVEGIGDTFGVDSNENGVYHYLTTDQVRFYPIDAPQHRAHAGGGGYAPLRYDDGPVVAPIPLEQVPSLAFSEIMRDIDLFVGVASVGNDPNWADGGPEGRHRDYWTRYAWGDLSEVARTRRQAIERLIPRLAIAERCRLTERFLVVRGDLRTYKIHLGSGNILMEPDDKYLCIVTPVQAVPGDGRLFLPFEGDEMLAIILSKAMLLADETRIRDQSIRRQIRL